MNEIWNVTWNDHSCLHQSQANRYMLNVHGEKYLDKESP